MNSEQIEVETVSRMIQHARDKMEPWKLAVKVRMARAELLAHQRPRYSDLGREEWSEVCRFLGWLERVCDGDADEGRPPMTKFKFDAT